MSLYLWVLPPLSAVRSKSAAPRNIVVAAVPTPYGATNYDISQLGRFGGFGFLVACLG
jgi:hypothetical protein